MPIVDRKSLIRRYLETYKTADRGTIEGLLSPEFTFTSPTDERIDRSAYFERCWSLAGSFERHELTLILAEGEDAIVHYEGRSKDGTTFRNIERFQFVGDQIRSIEVFFGLPQGALPEETSAQAPEEAIMALLEQRKEALQVKDARLVAKQHAANPVEFTLAPPLIMDDDVGVALNKWFKSWDGMIQWETRDPKITACGDVAFVTALEHMAGRRTDGGAADLWFRTTLGLKKIEGSWKITHEHQSVPFYMDGSNQAAVDLKPGVGVNPVFAPDRGRDSAGFEARQ